jgi:hypothetical protein
MRYRQVIDDIHAFLRNWPELSPEDRVTKAALDQMYEQLSNVMLPWGDLEEDAAAFARLDPQTKQAFINVGDDADARYTMYRNRVQTAGRRRKTQKRKNTRRKTSRR